MMRTEISLKRINILVTLILLLYTWDYAYTVLGSILPWLGASVAGILNLVAFSALCFLGLHCYVLCVLADPGSVPRDFEHDVEDVTSTYIQVKKKGGAARFCNKCSRPKPPRAHHCRTCNHCVLRMDHHCPWVNNCIGHGNYAAFLRFLFYTEVALIHCAVLLAMHTHALLHGGHGTDVISHIFQGSPDDAVAYLRVVLTHLATLSVTVPLAIGVGSLLGWHVHIVRQNKTTVEYHEGVTAHAFYREHGETFSHPYDVGVADNVLQVMGPSWGAWLAPAARLPGDGLHFPHSLRGASVAALRERLRTSEPAPAAEGTVQLTDRKGERKRESYADQL